MLGGVGLGTTDQVVPSQCSIRVLSPVVVSCPPTAKQLFWLGQAMPARALLGGPGAFGDGMRHPVNRRAISGVASKGNATRRPEESDRRRIV